MSEVKFEQSSEGLKNLRIALKLQDICWCVSFLKSKLCITLSSTIFQTDTKNKFISGIHPEVSILTALRECHESFSFYKTQDTNCDLFK